MLEFLVSAGVFSFA